FHDYHEMVRHPDIDLVSVSVRVPLHHAMVMAALHAGKHVYCEWPLGANLAEAEAMAALARATGVRTMIGLQANGDPVLLRLRELLAEGYVGEVLSCTWPCSCLASYNGGETAPGWRTVPWGRTLSPLPRGMR